jgi:hypothetical protein
MAKSLSTYNGRKIDDPTKSTDQLKQSSVFRRPIPDNSSSIENFQWKVRLMSTEATRIKSRFLLGGCLLNASRLNMGRGILHMHMRGAAARMGARTLLA